MDGWVDGCKSGVKDCMPAVKNHNFNFNSMVFPQQTNIQFQNFQLKTKSFKPVSIGLVLH